MQDETIPAETSEQSKAEIQNEHETQHLYIETSGDLLAKPNALSEILEVERSRATLIFCNSPSDADFVEVLLRKRGIKATKLIGHVPSMKVSRSIQQIKSGELSVIVVTDVAAQLLSVSDFDLVINYSIHSDPEIYLQRSGAEGGTKGPKKTISLIGPLDITHFHYLKKIVEFPFTKAELPSSEELAKARILSLMEEAKEKGADKSDNMRALAALVLGNEEKEAIVCLLLQNTLEVLPTLSNSGTDRGYGEDESTGRSSSRQGGRGREGSGRYSSRDSRESRDSRDGRYDRSGRRSRWNDGDSDNMGSDYPRRRDMVPPKKDLRLYIGKGQKEGFSEETFQQILAENCSESASSLKRFSNRTNYSFADFPEEVGEAVIEACKNTSLLDGDKLYIIKAAVIPGLKTAIEPEEEVSSNLQDSCTEEEDQTTGVEEE